MPYRILVLFFMGAFFACKTPLVPIQQVKNQPVRQLIKQVELSMQEIKAIDIQEQITGHDEVLLAYQIGIIERDSLIYSRLSTVYLGNAKQGQKLDLDTLSSLSLELKPGQALGIQMALWEVDDYQKMQKIVRQVNNVGGFLQIPIHMLEWSSVSNPLTWFLWGSRISGWGLDWWAHVDRNDLLGVSEITWNWNDIPTKNSTRYKRGTWKGGKRGLNEYVYSFAYQIKVKDISK
jgi:hypothetical protein